MEPIVFDQLALDHLSVVDHVIGNLGVGQDQGHSIVPRQLAFGTVHGHPGRHLELHTLLVHLRVGNAVQDLPGLHIGHRLEVDAADGALAGNGRSCRNQEAASPIVQQPLHLEPLLQHPERHTVGLEVIGLALIHRDEQPARLRSRGHHQQDNQGQHP